MLATPIKLSSSASVEVCLLCNTAPVMLEIDDPKSHDTLHLICCYNHKKVVGHKTPLRNLDDAIRKWNLLQSKYKAKKSKLALQNQLRKNLAKLPLI